VKEDHSRGEVGMADKPTKGLQASTDRDLCLDHFSGAVLFGRWLEKPD
jgi:hypothetical protein